MTELIAGFIIGGVTSLASVLAGAWLTWCRRNNHAPVRAPAWRDSRDDSVDEDDDETPYDKGI